MTVIDDCCHCPRLVAHRQTVHEQYPSYYCRPVQAFGADNPRLLIVGLAPGLHGANASGRPFTGDASGRLLFETLYKFGYASDKTSSAGANTKLYNCRITNAVKCLPPNNKPSGAEVNRCNNYLKQEINSLQTGSILLVLGVIAHQAVLKACSIPLNQLKFKHQQIHRLDKNLHLVDSYHCSRYNIQTGRLTVEMFERVFESINRILA